MEPANPPLPAPTKRPFQLCSGSHTSKRIAESLLGRKMPVTRQNAGSPVIGGRASETTSESEETSSALAMVVSSSFRDLSEPQSTAKRNLEETAVRQSTSQ